jgi:hypothetical protein
MVVVTIMTKQNRIKGKTKVYKTLHRKLKIDQEPGVNSSAPEG